MHAAEQKRVNAMAPLVRPINGVSFLAWSEQFLAPEIKAGDIVVMDYQGSHQVDGVAGH